jgi:hypothetical protein
MLVPDSMTTSCDYEGTERFELKYAGFEFAGFDGILKLGILCDSGGGGYPSRSDGSTIGP